MTLENLAKDNVLKRLMEMVDEDIKKKLSSKKPQAVSVSLTVASPKHEGRLHELREKLMGKKED